jgi:hypothetical protein
MRVKRFLVFGVVAVLMALVLTRCTTFQVSGLQMGLVINGQGYEKVGKFSEKKWTNKFLGWGVNGGTLFNLSSDAADPKVREAVGKHVQRLGGDGVVDVEIKYGSNPLQWIITALTGAIWMPGTVTVTGTVVKAVRALEG